MSTAALDLRGRMYRDRRLMQPAETTEFLRRQKVANVGTVDANGRPYVVPLVYIFGTAKACRCRTLVPEHGT